MLYLLFIGMIGVCTVLALSRWRWGVLAAIAIGLLQDPVRKMIPGTPGLLTMASLPVWFAVAVGAMQPWPGALQRFWQSMPKLHRYLRLFCLYLVIPAAISFTYGRGTWQITLLGIVLYSSTFMMLVAGWRLGQDQASLARVMAMYVVLGAVLLIGGLLEVRDFGARWPAIGTAALDHVWVTHRTGEAVYMRAGFFRGPDIMGWHATMLCMIALIMALRAKGAARYMFLGVALWAFLNIWICGRRKMISMIPVFVGCMLMLDFRLRGARRFIPIIGTVLVAVGLGWQFIGDFDADRSIGRFYGTILEEWDSQISNHAIRSVATTVRQAGVFGYGLGMSQQGIHHIQAEKPRVWQESGPSKLFVELGVPGAILFIGLLWIVFRTAYEVLKNIPSQDDFVVYAGIFSMLVANVVSALVSAQIYGDPFVIMILTLMLGILLSGHLGRAGQNGGNAEMKCG